MTFGKYGPAMGDHRLMKDIPSTYLLWLWDNVVWNSDIPAHAELKVYLKKTMNALLSEAPDYILKHSISS